MPVRVHIENFQSIKNMTVEIHGLTVVTGANNSGKTAIMRAVRGVFTNAPAGPLVRQGAAYLRVTLTFPDGAEVTWEKGWTKPDQKGSTVNRYFLNGKELENVGRGVPVEIADLGVREIQASTDRIWPQIAEQFDGTLFLLNKTGSAVAEALSDVERVGKLTKALRLSEKDKRSVEDELRVRKKDVKLLQEEVASYKGLDDLSAAVREIDPARVTTLFEGLREISILRRRYQEGRRTVESLKGFDPAVVPGAGRVAPLRAAASEVKGVRSLRDRWEVVNRKARAYKGLDAVVVPDATQPEKIRAVRKQVLLLSTRLKRARSDRDFLADFEAPVLPSFEKARRIAEVLERVRSFQGRYNKVKALVKNLDASCVQVLDDAARAEEEVREALGERGLCPTCKTVHEGGYHVEGRA